MAEVRFQGVRKQYGANVVIESFDLDIRDEELMVLVGPSGCGKSTALRMVAGLEEIEGGTISIGGRVVNDLPPKDRDIAMVFQSYALYPHMSVRENLEFGLRIRKTPRAEMNARVDEAAQILDITHLLDRRPKEMSGGQRQRVAVGRAIVRKPAVFLFDEPLSNLDAKLRVQTRAEITKLQKRLQTTTLYVTHDQIEAMTMGHRIAVMKDGRLQQVGTPLEVYERPANLFVASFIGTPPMNLVPSEVVADGAGLAVAASGFRLPLPERWRAALGAAGRQVVLGVRPENLREAARQGSASSAGGGPTARLAGTVELAELLGYEVIAHVRVGEDLLIAKLDPHRAPALGDPIELLVELDGIHLFDAGNQQRLAA
ncbi:MAG TPA: sn-glycerol-3-phosphate ABC transporter ATP-binding protein UgpC [Thermoanaerobaculia bacterium]|nr:sn-glycerol-3-phosphate ABC transporter ATP-binding protein UgpC [Thermoanaerobaculia bacterium]